MSVLFPSISFLIINHIEKHVFIGVRYFDLVFYFCLCSLGISNTGSAFKSVFWQLTSDPQKSLIHFPSSSCSALSLFPLHFSRHFSFKCPRGTKQGLCTCRWFQWNLGTLLFRAPHERHKNWDAVDVCDCVRFCCVCWMCVFMWRPMRWTCPHAADVTWQGSGSSSVTCPAISNVSLGKKKDPNPLSPLLWLSLCMWWMKEEEREGEGRCDGAVRGVMVRNVLGALSLSPRAHVLACVCVGCWVHVWKGNKRTYKQSEV